MTIELNATQLRDSHVIKNKLHALGRQEPRCVSPNRIGNLP